MPNKPGSSFQISILFVAVFNENPKARIEIMLRLRRTTCVQTNFRAVSVLAGDRAPFYRKHRSQAKEIAVKCLSQGHNN